MKIRALVAGAAVAALAGCAAVGPNFKTPSAPRADRWDLGGGTLELRADGAAQTIELARPTDSHWWTYFGSSALDGLVAKGLSDSPTLEAAHATLKAAHYAARAGAGAFLPGFAAAATATHYRSAPARFGFHGTAYDYDLYTLDGGVGYAIDLFGGGRRQAEALQAGEQSRRQAMGSAYLLLTGSIVQAAIARAGYAAEVATAEDIVRRETARRDVASAQVAAGHLAAAGALDTDQRLAAAREDLNLAQDRLRLSEGLLRKLLGLEPAEPLPALPALNDIKTPRHTPVSLPSQLVRQRPDILQAEADLHRASADVGVATAALFPSINLTGNYGAAAFALTQIGGINGRFWSLGPTLDIPVLSDGSRWFVRKQAQSAYQAALADYRATVLSALQQTSSAIGELYTDADAATNARAIYEAARAKAEVAQARSKAGLISADEVISAEIDADRARLALIGARSKRLQDVVELYLACGGGWTAADAG